VKRSLELAKMNARVGVMALAGFVILVWVLFFPVRGVSFFTHKIKVTGYYERVDSLRRNAPVYFRGTEVGSVDSVTIIPNRPGAPLQVVISIEQDILPLLPKTTRMDIVAQGLLGDVFVELKADPLRSGDEPMLADGDVLDTRPYDSVLAGMNGLTGQVKLLLDQVNGLLAQVHSGHGTVGRLVEDDTLYRELVKAVHSLDVATTKVNDIQTTINTKLLDPNTKAAVDHAVASAQRLIDNADELTEKAQAVRWHLSLGLDKYEGELYGATASLRIIPNRDRYYEGGVSYFNESLSTTADNNSLGSGYIGYNAVLAWRVLGSPVFFRGGIKRSSPDVGLDWRVGEMVPWLPVEVDFDAYHFGNVTPQLDLGAMYAFAQAFNLTLGVENFTDGPMFRAGLELIYDDEDLTSILVKAKTGL
jgi:phospholipid/cholesterol/gamma-HCH transport system substrate-binding protein